MTDHGFVTNCLLFGRTGERLPFLERTAEGRWIPRLDRYVLMPIEEFESRLRTASETLEEGDAQ